MLQQGPAVLDIDCFLDRLASDPLTTVVNYYASRLRPHRKAMSFLKRRALQNSEDAPVAIGFVDRTLGSHIPGNASKRGKLIRSKLKEVGVLRPNGREHFRGMVTAPLNMIHGKELSVGGIFGLRIDMSNGGAQEQSVGSGVFNAQALQSFSELIVCENVKDAWALIAAGHHNAICIQDYVLPEPCLANIKRAIFASTKIDTAPFAHCECFSLKIPHGQSIQGYAIEHQNDPEPLAQFVRNAAWMDVPRTKATESDPEPTPKQAPDAQAKNPSASPVPALPSEDLETVVSDAEVIISIESRRWRIRNLERNKMPGVLRVNVLVSSVVNQSFHVDTFDLYHARSRRAFLAEAAQEIGQGEATLRSDLGRILLKLEQLQHEVRLSARGDGEPKKPVELSPEERTAALKLLRSENLLERILEDFDQCGIVGERNGKMVGYLVATSRLLDKPLGLIVQSSSAAGKSSLTNAVLKFMPAEALFTCSAMTSQSLYYLGKTDLKHRILSIAEEEGARHASYGLKLLQSEGELSLVSTAKEKGMGKMATQRHQVNGPVALMLTTTANDLDPELMNRCLVVNVDESESQTAAIQAQQRFAFTFQGFQQGILRASIEKLHQNAQRLLRPLAIHNPFASQLGFVNSQTRFRRDQEKYLTLINTITLLHQYQRETQTTELNGHSIEYLEVTREDIGLANRIAQWALGRSIDELPGPTRRLLCQLFDWVQVESRRQGVAHSELTFTRRQAREALKWNTTHFRENLERLVVAEYVVPHGRGQGKLHRYSLLYDGRGREGEPSLLGLVDADSLIDATAGPMRATWQ